jgi:hypothetical protein
MSELHVYLPQGDLGLELEPVSRRNGKSRGIRVRGWKSTIFQLKCLSPGSTITRIDDIACDTLPFMKAIDLLRSSECRKITYLNSSLSATAAEGRNSSINNKHSENRCDALVVDKENWSYRHPQEIIDKNRLVDRSYTVLRPRNDFHSNVQRVAYTSPRFKSESTYDNNNNTNNNTNNNNNNQMEDDFATRFCRSNEGERHSSLALTQIPLTFITEAKNHTPSRQLQTSGFLNVQIDSEQKGEKVVNMDEIIIDDKVEETENIEYSDQMMRESLGSTYQRQNRVVVNDSVEIKFNYNQNDHVDSNEESLVDNISSNVDHAVVVDKEIRDQNLAVIHDVINDEGENGELDKLRSELQVLKTVNRKQDGNLMLYKFQMRKQKTLQNANISIEDKTILLAHLMRFYPTLHAISGRVERVLYDKGEQVDHSTQCDLQQTTVNNRVEEGRKNNELIKKVYFQETFIEKLKLQLHASVDAQIRFHEMEAEKEVEMSMAHNSINQITENAKKNKSDSGKKKNKIESRPTSPTKTLSTRVYASTRRSPKSLIKMLGASTSTSSGVVNTVVPVSPNQKQITPLSKRSPKMKRYVFQSAREEETKINASKSIVECNSTDSTEPVEEEPIIATPTKGQWEGGASLGSAWLHWKQAKDTPTSVGKSPISFKSHLEKLREDNQLLNKDIMNFKETLLKYRKECLNYECT